MAGVTDSPFRRLARECGAGLVYTEMVSDKGLLFGGVRSRELLTHTPGEHPLAVQVFGAEAATLARAAVTVARAGADIIDINMGCPVPKVVRNGAGAALMRDPGRAGAIIRAVVGAVACPVTVKLRKAWGPGDPDAVVLAQAAVEAGASAVTVHGRTRDQYYVGRADWDIIGRVVAAVPVPVIGNGDVFEPEDAVRMLRETGCAGVMVGRGALGNPWIFRRTRHLLATGQELPPPTARERRDMIERHLGLLLKVKGERRGLVQMRKHAAWYLRGLPGAARVRARLVRSCTPQEMMAIVDAWLQALEEETSGPTGSTCG
jgi:nifR3 family TIM-barrel protein